MRILIDNGSYRLMNLGDVAMLQATVRRLRQSMPEARLAVLTSDPDRLAILAPDCEAIPDSWPLALEKRRLFPIPHRLVPAGVLRQKVLAWEARARVERAGRLLRERNSASEAARKWFDALDSSDAVVAVGGGYFNDSFVAHSLRLLGHLRLAQEMRKQTALFGQGIGPISDAGLAKALGQTFSRARVVALRDNALGPRTLRQWGLPAAVFTGDDALELVPMDEAAPIESQSVIGLTIRAARYSGTNPGLLTALQRDVTGVCEAKGLRIRPVPIDFGEADSDEAAALRVAGERYRDPDYRRPDAPSEVIALARDCRVVVTGSYHAALFGLAQGVPVVGLEGSSYYAGKFEALAALFPGGVQRFSLSAAGVEGRFAAAFERAERTDSASRQQWREKALELRTAGRACYEAFVRTLSSPPGGENGSTRAS